MRRLVLILVSCSACHPTTTTACNRYVDAFNRCMDEIITTRNSDYGIVKLNSRQVCANLGASEKTFYECLLKSFEKRHCYTQQEYEEALINEQDCTDIERP